MKGATTFPLSLLPVRATLASYQSLCAHVGMGRYLVNSAVLTR
jgi:hypothetical protein